MQKPRECQPTLYVTGTGSKTWKGRCHMWRRRKGGAGAREGSQEVRKEVRAEGRAGRKQLGGVY